MGKIIRNVALLLVAVALMALTISSSTVRNADLVWNEQMTMGEMGAKNYYIYYTDLACPYCDVVSRQIFENMDEFREYLAKNNILFEVRLTDFLYEYGEHKPDMSLWSAEGAYCAADEGKFWEYYKASVQALWDDYHSKGIGVSKTGPEITGMTEDYWLEMGRKIGLTEENSAFFSCMGNHTDQEKVRSDAEKVAKQVESGLPYFKFNNFKTSGFDQSWGWDYVKRYLDAGL